MIKDTGIYMEFENLLTLMKTMSDSELTEFSYEENGVQIMMSKLKERSMTLPQMNPAAVVTAANVNTNTVTDCQTSMPSSAVSASIQTTVPVQAALKEDSAAENAKTSSEPEGNLVKSPLVGVFYAAPAEDAPPFVKVGDHVTAGQTLAIVEAMKLMNEIESDFSGTIAEVLVENGQAVEYGQPLFRLV